jgi:hypothetical protein
MLLKIIVFKKSKQNRKMFTKISQYEFIQLYNDIVKYYNAKIFYY